MKIKYPKILAVFMAASILFCGFTPSAAVYDEATIATSIVQPTVEELLKEQLEAEGQQDIGETVVDIFEEVKDQQHSSEIITESEYSNSVVVTEDINVEMDKKEETALASVNEENINLLDAVMAFAAGVEVNSEDQLRQAINDAPAGTKTVITVTGNITLTGSTIYIQSNKNIYLQGNGDGEGGNGEHTIKVSGGIRHFTCQNNGTLTLADGVILDGNNLISGVIVNSNSQFFMEGGTIQNVSTASNNGAVYVNGGSFTISGGVISHNSGNGSPVFVLNGNLEITGNGKITENTATRGGGVYISNNLSGSFTMSGGEISYNSATMQGGGIHVNGSFDMSGGKINNNTASSGSGIYTTAGIFNMTGGEISNNEASQYGGGIYSAISSIVYSQCKVVINGGKISDNRAGLDGGGLYLSNHGNEIYSGEISNNIASRNGGGFFVSRNYLNISSGNIHSNIADSGGGIYSSDYSYLDISGGSFSENTALSGAYSFDLQDITTLEMYRAVVNGISSISLPFSFSHERENMRFAFNNYDINYTVGGLLQYTVSYNANGGTGGIKTISEENHIAYTAEQANVSRYSYRLSGWATSATGGIDYSIGSSFQITKDIELFAVWSHDGETYYNVKYNANGGSGGTTAKVIPEQSHTIYSASQSSVSRHGYKLDGWATSASGTVVYAAGGSFTPTKDIELFAVWSHDGATYYNVKYNANGGSGGTTAKVIPEQSHTVYTATQASVSRHGYKLDGWATSATGAVVYTAGSSFTPTKDIELFAVWSHDGTTYYNVKYNANGGSGGTTAKVIPEQSHTIYSASQSSVSRHGYKLDGWATSAGGTVVYAAGSSFTPTKDIELFAVWSHDGITYYNVKYNANGGSGGTTAKVIPEQSHTVYTATQASVSRYGYKLDGWATSATGAVVYAAGSSFTPTKDIELFAVWSHDGATYYNVKYNANGGSGGTTAKVIPEQSHTVYTATQASVSRYGYKLDGWATTAGGTVVYAAGSSLTPTKDIELFAVWSHDGATYYNVKYNANGGSGGTTAKVIPEQSHTVYTATQASVSRYGYKLDGWATTAGGTVVYAAGSSLTPTKDIELFAVWSHDGITYYNVKYNANGGSGGTTAKVIPEQSHTVYTATQASVSRYGYKLDGWATSATGAVVYTAGSSLTPTKDIELFAVWSHDGNTYYNVQYYANGGTGGSVEKVKPEESHIIFTADQASVYRYGYKLDGWATSAAGDVVYTAGTSITPTESIELFAVWSHNGETFYNVKYNANGGSGGTTVEIIPEQSHTIYDATKASVSRFGYKLVGWALSAMGSATYAAGSTFTPAANIELFAVWVHDGETYHLLNYHPNEGEGGTQVKIIPEESHTIYDEEKANVIRYGYKVVGWATSPNGEPEYIAGDAITLD